MNLVFFYDFSYCFYFHLLFFCTGKYLGRPWLRVRYCRGAPCEALFPMLLRFSIIHHHHFMIKQLLDTAFVDYYVNTRNFTCNVGTGAILKLCASQQNS